MVFPEFNFKFTYTDIVIRYLFDTNKTMAEFINYIINNVYIDFDVRNDLIIEIIEAGQNTNQYESEMAPALLPSSIAFKNYYANKNIKTPNYEFLFGNFRQLRREKVIFLFKIKRFFFYKKNKNKGIFKCSQRMD